MKDDITEEQSNAILQALDKALDNGPWEDSNFLRVIGKNLQRIRDDFAQEIAAQKKEQTRVQSSSANHSFERVDEKEVYISLYSTGGSVLQVWERVIANLPKQVVSRPVYENEEDVQRVIKSKENPVNEAYVVIYINRSDILSIAADKTPLDKFGKPLMILKDKAVNLLNISRFVHSSGIYTYQKGRLIKKPLSEM